MGDHLKSPPTSLIQRGVGGLFLIVFLCLFVPGCNNRPQPTGVEFDEIDTSREPFQTSIASQEPILIKVKRGDFRITPVAEYKIAALIVSNEFYSEGWNAKVSPVDLGLAWGKLADPEFRKYVSYNQSSRWLSFKVKADSPLDFAYIVGHASNHHIIPATQNIWYAVKAIKKKKKVILEGLLVNVAGNYEGKNVRWNTSLSRTDSGDGACEILYLTKARIVDKVYE